MYNGLYQRQLLQTERNTALVTQTATQPLLEISNPYFAKGYRLGRIWYLYGEVELPIDDMYLITNIANYCEKGMHNNPEWLSERVGFLLGMVSGGVIPEEPGNPRQVRG